MTRVRSLVVGASVAAVLMTAGALPPSSAQDQPAAAAAKPAEAPKPATVKVTKETLKVETALKGTVEADNAAEVSIRPEAWAGALTVVKAVEHGASVKKGDVLVELEMEKIDQAIKDLRIDRELGELSLRQTEEELPVLEKLLPLDLADAEREKKQADEDLVRYLEVDKPQSEKLAEFLLKNSAHNLEYVQEELKQLQKMYRTKDLTEETEEMILKRQRHQVEASEFQLKNAQIRHDQTLKIDLPRQEQKARDGVIRQALALQRTRITLPSALNTKRLALAKQRIERERTAEKLAELEKDREAMIVRAPSDGVVYYGKAARGTWGGATAYLAKLQKGGTLTPSDVFMTVVAPRPVFVRAGVEEKEVGLLKAGMKGKAVPVAYPDMIIPATLAKVSAIPQSPGNFEARIDLATDKVADADALAPGMAVSVTIVSLKKENVLTVPASAVFTNEDDDSKFVYVFGKDDKPEKKAVKVGKAVGGKAEILEGLKDGDEILANKP